MTLYKRVISFFLAVLLTISMIFWSSGFILSDEKSMEVYQDIRESLPVKEDIDVPEPPLNGIWLNP